MFIAPFDKDDIFALLMDNIADGVSLVTLMSYHHLITRDFGTVDPDVKNVAASATTVHGEAILPADEGLLKTFSSHLHL